MTEQEEKKLAFEIRALRRELDEHDSLIATRELIRHFFEQDGKEINIKFISAKCGSEVIVTINSESISSHELRGFDLHEIVKAAIKKFS